MADIQWPPLMSAPAAAIQSLLFFLEQSQWWPPERLLEHQLHQAGLLLRHACRTSPLFGQRLAAFDLEPPLTVERWQGLPLLSRNDIQEGGELLFNSPVPPHHGQVFSTITSGSTGQPVTVRGTELNQLFWNCLTLRDHLWHQRAVSGTHAIIRVFDSLLPKEGRRQPDWGVPFSLIYDTGPCAQLSLQVDIAQQAAWLNRIDPHYLLTYPSNLRALLDHCEKRGIRPPRLRQVRTIGESLPPDVRGECLRIWNAPVVDLYSSQEVGYIALQCPASDCYHIQAENLLVEILDRQGKPCQPGSIGEVVVTALHNFATPLIRYAIGDFAEVADPCPCGRGLPAIRRILGRRHDLVTLPTGQRFWPVVGARRFRDIAPIRQFQAIQRTLDLLEVRLVVERGLTGDEEERIRELIVHSLGYPFQIRLTYCDEIAVKAGKHAEFRSDL